MKRLILFVSGTLCLLGVSTFAANGVVISMKATSGGSTTTNQTLFDANHLRAEMAGRGGVQNTVVFDGAKQAIYMIDDSKKTYTEITKDDIDKLSAQMAQARSQMQGAMANMPEEQRKQFEAMMARRGGGAGTPGMATPAAKPTYKKTGTDKVGKWTCDKYEGYQGEKKTSELCTVAPSALGFSESDFAISKDFAKFFSGFANMMPQRQPQQIFSLGTLEDGFVGFPVRSINYGADGSVTSTMEMTDITHQNIPDSSFAPPAGYAKQDLMNGMGRGRRGGF